MMKSGPRNCMSPQSCNKVSEKRWEIQRMKSIHQSILEDDDELSCGYWRWWGTVCDWLKLIIGVDDIWWVVSLRLVGIAEGSPESEFRQCLKQQTTLLNSEVAHKTPILILGDSLKSYSLKERQINTQIVKHPRVMLFSRVCEVDSRRDSQWFQHFMEDVVPLRHWAKRAGPSWSSHCCNQLREWKETKRSISRRNLTESSLINHHRIWNARIEIKLWSNVTVYMYDKLKRIWFTTVWIDSNRFGFDCRINESSIPIPIIQRNRKIKPVQQFDPFEGLNFYQCDQTIFFALRVKKKSFMLIDFD